MDVLLAGWTVVETVAYLVERLVFVKVEKTVAGRVVELAGWTVVGTVVGTVGNLVFGWVEM